MRVGRVAVGAALAMTLAGCSLLSDDEPPPEPETKPTNKKSKKGPVTVNGGVASPDSLTDFDCGQNDDGTWSASGTIENAAANHEDYRVTIWVAPATATTGTAHEITIADVPGGESEAFEAEDLPITDGPEPTCSIQVARLTPP